MSHVERTAIRELLTRRDVFRGLHTGLVGIALGSLLNAASPAAAPRYDVLPKQPHFAPRARRVILLFQNGGPSQMDLFDPKPELRKRDGQKPGDGFINTVDIKKTGTWMGSPFAFARHGASGIELSELVPGLARHADDITVIRSMVSEHSNHEQAIWYFNTGLTTPGRPAMGSWVTYGLGTENQSLPAFAAIMHPKGPPVDGTRNFSSGWMPPVYQGMAMRAEGTPVLNLKPAGPAGAADARLQLLQQMNREHFSSRTDQLELEARIASYELAARMQIAASEALDLAREPQSMHDLYGTSDPEAGIHARQLLLARRLVERGVRFVQVLLNGQPWDTHQKNESGNREIARRTDGPAAALLTDLKQRGLFDDTLVIWGGEFGRTVYSQGELSAENYGRDHHPRCFSMWLAGGGIKGGTTYGETDEFSYNVVADPVDVHDLHATSLHLLGVDHTRLTFKFQGRHYRLTDVHGRVVRGLLS